MTILRYNTYDIYNAEFDALISDGYDEYEARAIAESSYFYEIAWEDFISDCEAQFESFGGIYSWDVEYQHNGGGVVDANSFGDLMSSVFGDGYDSLEVEFLDDAIIFSSNSNYAYCTPLKCYLIMEYYSDFEDEDELMKECWRLGDIDAINAAGALAEYFGADESVIKYNEASDEARLIDGESIYFTIKY